jgi:hypothetical protein
VREQGDGHDGRHREGEGDLAFSIWPIAVRFMNKEDLKRRTKDFGLRVMKLVRELPNDVPGKVIANQLMRSASSVGANYRSACRARSTAEFIAKLGVVLEEADESGH